MSNDDNKNREKGSYVKSALITSAVVVGAALLFLKLWKYYQDRVRPVQGQGQDEKKDPGQKKEPELANDLSEACRSWIRQQSDLIRQDMRCCTLASFYRSLAAKFPVDSSNEDGLSAFLKDDVTATWSWSEKIKLLMLVNQLQKSGGECAH